jgi:pilus assembly protein CpaF
MSIFSLRDKIQLSSNSSQDFHDFLERMKKDLRMTLESNPTYHSLNDLAIMGDPVAVTFFLNEIEKYLRTNPFSGDIPAAYRTVSEALFHEWKGFGPAYRWFSDPKYAESVGLQIVGDKIFVKERGQYRLFEHRFSNADRVQRLVRGMNLNDEKVNVSESNPEAELKMNDPLWPGRFIRLAIWIKPRVWDDFLTITCRRQIIEYLSLQDQAGTGSIPHAAVTMLKHLVQTRRNTVIAGPIESGKSTFANTVVGEQISSATDNPGVVMIEKHPESIIPYVFPNCRIIPVRASESELMDVGIKSLRMDVNIVYMTEMRDKEWEFFLWSGAKGFDGIIGTFHTTDAQDIPYQAAMSVFTKKQGALKGYLIEALRSSELVFIMNSGDDGKKRLERVSEIVYDEEKQTVYSNDLMRWNSDKQLWEYHDQLTPDMLQRMDRKNPQATQKFMDELKKLAAQHPMQNPKTESVVSRQVLQAS